MKVIYDQETDTMSLIFRDAAIAESDEDKPGLILDYDENGKIVSIEVLDASKNIQKPQGIIFESNTTTSSGL